MFVVCCLCVGGVFCHLRFGDGCALFVVCRLLSVVCCLLQCVSWPSFAGCCVLNVRCVLVAIVCRCLLRVVCCLAFVGCCLVFVVC